ncbi:MAG: Fic family protein [Phycisphaerales bacterium]|nr:MAG: Fic family protein [Phycisphaerales bacterium]
MKKPTVPPGVGEVLEETQRADRLNAVLETLSKPSWPDRYLHWHKLRHHKPPTGLSHREWWLALKLHRYSQYRTVPLRSAGGIPFNYVLSDPAPERLHDIDLRLGGSIGMPSPITNPDTKDQYLVRSLIEEAITSSQLEGAATTRSEAKDMIRSGRPPRDRSEQMILNNYRTMQQIGKLKHKPLTKKIVLELHRLVTDGALNDPADVGRIRRADQKIDVGDDLGQVFHVPPPADQLDDRMAEMCNFANGRTPSRFIHPVVRSIILHFWLAYDHPFVDGNGRTARALFYWSMLHHGFSLCEFISISEIILKAPAKYGRAFLYTETDDNDLTYFLLYHLDVLRRAIKQLHDYVVRRTERIQAVERRMRTAQVLNHRQQALISHALRHIGHRYTIESHRTSHNVVHQTARTDLLDLARRGLMTKEKIGRQWHFTPVTDLERRLTKLS